MAEFADMPLRAMHALFRASFRDIENMYEGLTAEEQVCISREEFDVLIRWITQDKHGQGGAYCPSCGEFLTIQCRLADGQLRIVGAGPNIGDAGDL